MEPNPLLWDIVELATQLRQERLFVNSEQALLQELNEKVLSASSKLAQVAWMTSHQRLNLNKLVLSCPDSSPAICCRKANSLDSTKFIEAQVKLGFQKSTCYGEMLCQLRDSPELVARSLVAGDRCLPEEMPNIVHSLVTGLYTSCVLPKDKNTVLKILSHLISLQLIQSDMPRRLLRQGSCAFSRLYSSFHESLFSAKLYLTAALHSPIMQLLMMEEKYLDVDPEKIALRLEEKVKRCENEASGCCKIDVESHRTSTLKSLVTITQAFISSINDNLHCFPSSVCWLVNQIYTRLSKANTISDKEVFAMCTDLVFTLFICPAIVKPEPYGITDVPISQIARFNLIQVAQIIQMLAMRKFQSVDARLEDLYSQFDKDCISSIIETMIESCLTEEPNLDDNTKFEGLSRNAAMFTETELNSLVSFLRTISNENNCEDTKLQKELSTLLSNIPQQAVNGHLKSANSSPERAPKKPSILAKGKNKIQNGANLDISPEEEDILGYEVLVIPYDPNSETALGLVSEQKILAMGKECDPDRSDKRIKSEKVERSEGQEKRTRFSLSHDDGSIGNTSDNLEVVSEAPSNHSVASSLELETEDQNDNLSDMVSANVSGRGSPNISGRDTPSSQITEGEEVVPAGSSVRVEFNPPPPHKISTQPRFDIDDKFGKFEIKTLIEGADETFSLVSDTWSTDVLASDSEILEQQPSQPLLAEPLPTIAQVGDALETASEAWSTDVVTSDTERLTEVDTDDTASVARSDDTGRSEVESRGEPEITEEAALLPPPPVPVSGSIFRVPRDEPRESQLQSLSRNIETVGACTPANVTGKGGARSDYRRRTIEYVDNNRNIYSKLGAQEESNADKVDSKTVSGFAAGCANGSLMNSSPTHSVPISEGSPLHTSLLPPASSASSSKMNFRTPHQPISSNELYEDRVERDLAAGSSGGCFSACSSSSGSSVSARNSTTEINLSSTPIVLQNGTAIMQESCSVSKPAPTGAIPKSISFDKTAERGDKESLDEDGKPKRSFFRSFKLPFKSRRGKSFRSEFYDSAAGGADSEICPPLRLRRGLSEETRSARINDTSDDILAKYRGQRNDIDMENKSKANIVESGVTEKPVIVEKGYDLFEDARKKLRLALSTTEVQQLPESLPMRQAWIRKENELVAFLQLQLAEAINLQDNCLIPQLYETLRCVKMLSDVECRKLFECLKEDYKNRMPYNSYLIKCRQSLLSTLSHVHRLMDRVIRDRTVVLEFLSSMCVRLFLERRESQLAKFVTEFQSLTLADEKSDILDSFLASLSTEMERDLIWRCASEEQLNQAKLSVERSLSSRVYVHAMYPNGDGDISRDQVLQEHIAKLAKVITPDHKDLRIPQMFHGECPWLSAQAEIAKMGAYRSPKDKLRCALRCITTIINLLSLTCIPAADDLMPVLVYVLIMANPGSLLSTVEYVTSFYGNRLEGEEQYYWTQFCSAIEFIKTMDYVIGD
ncbi:GTPase activating protein and VPS9 domains 1 isoform X2 [Rhodnius prolixus]|uniref:GTPase activating protein and VPS9 domains 1 isoform X2 n=1 Tax=Rhodnius prolixus TaxID=13249 RepID=UPI003D18BC2D